MIEAPSPSATIALVVLFLFLVKASRVGKRGHGLPPGPRTLPLLGNLHIFPTEYAHYKFTEWAREFGSIYSLMVGPNVIVVLTSMNAVKEIMDRRSVTTADRPDNYMAYMITGGLNVGISRYNDSWKVLRKAAQAILTPQAIYQHLPIQKAEATQLMYDCLKSPKDFYNHIRRYSNSTILSITYGKRSPRYETHEATTFFRAQHLWEAALAPGAHPPVDLLPFLKYVPERWAPWKTLCKEVRKLQRGLYFGLLTECEERMKHGEENGCYMEEVVKRQEEFDMTREQVGYLGGALLEGGSDTTSAFLQSVVLMLVAFPDVQRKAQEEVDRVIGSDRPPTLEDWTNLPYLQAFNKEINRFRPIAPMAIPHATTADEHYAGYLIPKGATLFMNSWGINHDPDIYEDPETFNPDRYLQSEYGTKPGVDDTDFRHTLIFGAGRRICSGMQLANNSFMLNTMNFIWAFNFLPAVDVDTKKPIVVDLWAYHKGILTGPEPFQCSITPRSPDRAQMIESEFVDVIDTFLPYEESLSPEDRAWVTKSRAALR